MSNSDSDDDNAVRYGTPLEPYEEDEIPTKRKYQQPTDQYAVDAHGRRRFHGAFTGGFSAGFGNTVGSQEGWSPATFKSSRGEKAQSSSQRPEDFMDEEDRSEFGIAPKYMQTHSEFSGQKRSRQTFHDGPIPGEPVLEQMIRAVHETAAVRMLRDMGWRPGQGTGDRVTRQDKQKAREQQKVYGCYVPEELRQAAQSEAAHDSDQSTDSEFEYDTLFAPDDYEPYILNRKSDRFGLGYQGLSRHSVLGNMVGEYGEGSSKSHLKMKDKGKKVSIRGQAFGVGAFEADDEDIYSTEDMSHYDFAIGGPSTDKQKTKQTKEKSNNTLVGFVRATRPLPPTAAHPPPALPRDFTPAAAGARRTRFSATQAEPRDQGLGRHELTAVARGALLGEAPAKPTEVKQTDRSVNEDLIAKITGRNVNFVSTSSNNDLPTSNSNMELLKDRIAASNVDSPLLINKIDPTSVDLLSSNNRINPSSVDSLSSINRINTTSVDLLSSNDRINTTSVDLLSSNNTIRPSSMDLITPNEKNVDKIIDFTKPSSNTPDFISIKDSGKELTRVFKPFASNPSKQARYESYLKDKDSFSERDGSIDRLSEWEREREMVEFEQAAKLYRPLTGIMGDRFTHASEPDDATNPLTAVAKSHTNYGLATAEQIAAAENGVYGIMTRSKTTWRPHSMVCKRFNVPEPGATRLEPQKDDKPKISYSIFSYLESSVHDKESFTKEQTKFSGSKSLRDIPKPDPKPAQSFINQTDNNTVKQTDQSTEEKSDVSFKRMTVAELFLKESEKTKEKGQEVTETIDQFDKMDLYKSIFLSDSEDDTINEDKTTKSDVDPAFNDFVEAPKNVLRNTSPPRGIFANIDFDELNSWKRNLGDKKTETSKEASKSESTVTVETNKQENMEVDQVYGPKIPETIQKRLEGNNYSNKDSGKKESIVDSTRKDKDVVEIDSSSSDSWVDAKEVKSKKKKNKSKHKKHKSKHKKSKHKKKDK